MPEWKLEIKKHLAGLNLRPDWEAEIIEELSDHLQQRYEELRAWGLGEDEVLREVMAEIYWRDFVPELQFSEKTAPPDTVPEGAAASGHFFEDLWKDLRFARRMLRKTPGFTAVAVLTLALGIGANTAVFTVVDSLILNPLPVEKISTLATINTTQAKKTAQSGDLQAISYLNLKDIRERTHAFRSLAGHSYPMAVTMTDKDQPRRVFAEIVTANYFETLDIRPFLGRFFLPSEDTTPGAAPVAVLGYMAWQGRFGGDPGILGRTIRLNETSFTIVGVGPKGFKGVYAVFGPDLWVPSMMPCIYIPLPQNYADSMILYVRSERDPSTVLEAVQAEIHNFDPRLPLEDVRTGTKVIDQALWWSKIGVGLLGAFGLLALGLASVGLYGIMAYSVNQRRREIGVRMALGADQGSVSFLVLRRGMAVVASGLGVGIVLSLLLGHVLSRFLYGVSGSDPLSLGGASLALLAVAFVACYLPARTASRVDPLVALRDA